MSAVRKADLPPEVAAARDEMSDTVARALLRIERNRERAARHAAARHEKPPPKEEAAGAPLPAASPLTGTTTTTAQHSHLEDGRGC